MQDPMKPPDRRKMTEREAAFVMTLKLNAEKEDIIAAQDAVKKLSEEQREEALALRKQHQEAMREKQEVFRSTVEKYIPAEWVQ